MTHNKPNACSASNDVLSSFSLRNVKRYLANCRVVPLFRAMNDTT